MVEGIKDFSISKIRFFLFCMWDRIEKCAHAAGARVIWGLPCQSASFFSTAMRGAVFPARGHHNYGD